MTGEGIVLPDEDAVVVAERFATLQEEFAPSTLMGTILVQRIALLSVRLDRAAVQEANALAARVAGAKAAMIDSRKAEAEFLMSHIHQEPRTNRRRLITTPEGLDLMIQAWEDMKTDLEDQTGTRWDYTYAIRAQYLNGIDPATIAISPYMAWTKASKGNFENILAHHFQEGMSKDAKQDLALMKLQELVDADLAAICALRAALDTSGQDAELERAPQIALFDSSKEAILARKYEAAAERNMLRALQELRQVDTEQVVEEPVTVPSPGALASFFPELPPALPERPRRPIPDPKAARKRGKRPG